MNKDYKFQRLLCRIEICFASTIIGAFLGMLGGTIYEIKNSELKGFILGGVLGFVIAWFYINSMIRILGKNSSSSRFGTKLVLWGAFSGFICSSLLHGCLALPNFLYGSGFNRKIYTDVFGIIMIGIIFGAVPGAMLGSIISRKLWRECRIPEAGKIIPDDPQTVNQDKNQCD